MCTRRLSERDFIQLSVTDAPPNKGSSSHNDLTSAFQSVFTKGVESQGGPYVQYMDACHAAIRAQQHSAKLSRFLFKQFFLASQKTGVSSGRLQREYDSLEQKFTQYQQSSKAELMEAQRTAQVNEDRVHSLQRELTTLQARNNELETLYRRSRNGSVSGSIGHSEGGSVGGGGRLPHNPYRHHTSTTTTSAAMVPPPPMADHHRRSRDDRPPQYIGVSDGGGSTGNNNTTSLLGRPTPIQINPSSSFATSTGGVSHGHSVRPLNGAPPIRQVHNQGYSFSRGRRSTSQTSGGSNHAVMTFRTSGGGDGGGGGSSSSTNNSINNPYTERRSYKYNAKYKAPSTRYHHYR
jgi:hypothetical protein